MMDVVLPKSTGNIYITGTTRGLGKALKHRFEIEYPFEEIIGLNRPEYDLNNVKKLLKTNFDIYILNAHYEWSQVELLYDLFEANKNRQCQIAVIGSVSADGDRKEVNRYAIQKKALDAACTQLQLVPSKCMITQFKFGRIDTDLVKDKSGPKIDPLDASRLVYDTLQMNSKNHYIKSITIDNKVTL